MTILSLIQDATDLLSLARPSVVVTSNDQQTRQLHAIAVQECKDLNRLWWTAMTREHTFATTATPEQSGMIPEDFDRFWPNSFFNRTTRREVVGPVSPQDWQRVQASGITASCVLAYRERDGAFLITPTPAAGETIAFEYISKNWARSSDLATARARWEDDTDTSYFDEWLITLGIVWRWKKSKGFPYSEDYDIYTAFRDGKQANDGGSSKLNLVSAADTMPPLPTVPESFSIS